MTFDDVMKGFPQFDPWMLLLQIEFHVLLLSITIASVCVCILLIKQVVQSFKRI